MKDTLYVIRLEELFWSAVLLAITMAIHGVGMLWTVQATEWLKGRYSNTTRLSAALAIVIVGSWLILSSSSRIHRSTSDEKAESSFISRSVAG